MTLEVVCGPPHACTNMIMYTYMCMHTHRHTQYIHIQFITSFIPRTLSVTERGSIVDANVDCVVYTHMCGSTCGCQCFGLRLPTWFSLNLELGWLPTSPSLSLSPFSAGFTAMHLAASGFSCECLGSERGSSCLNSQHSYPESHLPNSSEGL